MSKNPAPDSASKEDKVLPVTECKVRRTRAGLSKWSRNKAAPSADARMAGAPARSDFPFPRPA
ncbi:MAG: hypothetical protein ABIW76_13980, partial [Fibrobacteria bacterium]